MEKCARLLCAAFAVAMLPVLAQISPGPLSTAHHDLEGAAHCTNCHIFALGGGKKFKCTGCHAEIRARMEAKRGYHARVADLSKANLDCVKCHTDHYGPNFRIIKWDTTRDEFDHSKTGYLLQGKHAGLACARCHAPAFMSPAERKSIKVKDLSRTLLGLSPACSTCHKDVHRGTLGADCAHCHTFQTWKAATTFDHATARFPLNGLHHRVPCAKCHPAAPEGGVKFRDIPFAACQDCHADPHKGAFQEASFKGTCESCHTVDGWKEIRATASSFDHSKTKFPLNGKHASVNCFKCHKTSNFKTPVAHAKCMDCHEDIHEGQFKKRKGGGDCGPCHNEKSFKPATFKTKEHEQTEYPLLGKHAAVECAKCHLPAGKATKYHVPFGKCLDCHKDAHAGQFAGAPHQNKCEACHTVDGFKQSTFTLARHVETRFLLTGSHAAVACKECHKPPAGVFPVPPARYHYDAFDCQACHEDPHRGQFVEAANRRASQSCETCHTTRTWRDTGAFDHAKTDFALTGSHRAVACVECHRPAVAGKGAVKNVVFRGAPKVCSGCHEDVHGGQFKAGGMPVECSVCHTENKWRQTTFDHEKTTFSLAGAHVAVPCRGCHNTRTPINGKQVVVYKGTPGKCVDCHSGVSPLPKSGKSLRPLSNGVPPAPL